jgi:hypothetical protein
MRTTSSEYLSCPNTNTSTNTNPNFNIKNIVQT